MEEGTYEATYPTGCTPPKLYGLPKIHKSGTPQAHYKLQIIYL